MRRYKIFAAILAAVMIFSGCSSDVKTTSASSAEPTTTSASTTVSASSPSAETTTTTTPAATVTTSEAATTTVSEAAATTSEAATTTVSAATMTTSEAAETTTTTAASVTTPESTTTTTTTAASAAATAVSSSLTSSTTTTAAVSEPVKSEGFRVSGNTLLDANGNAFIMRGINHAHAWYKRYDDTALEAIAATGANCVRLVLANGIQWEKDSLDNINRLTDKCKSLKMIAIVEVHDGTGSDDPKVLEEIADYWIEMKNALIGKESYVILNIANEWFGSWGKEKQWADAYCSVIPKLRAAGIKNTIMVDSAGWGQDAGCIAKEGERIFASDELANTMFSIHMYGSAGKSRGSIKKYIDGVLGKGLCLCIGEFGYTHSDGDVQEDFLMEYCVQTAVGYLGWSWKGNSGGVEYLDLAKEWDGSKLSQEWGDVLVNGANGIKETSSVCTIF